MGPNRDDDYRTGLEELSAYDTEFHEKGVDNQDFIEAAWRRLYHRRRGRNGVSNGGAEWSSGGGVELQGVAVVGLSSHWL